jgi:hypothetical protein
MEAGVAYTFKRLEQELRLERYRGSAFVVEHVQYGQRAIMHVFKGNFCGDWLAGDGVLFFDDGGVHSSEANTEYRLVRVISSHGW